MNVKPGDMAIVIRGNSAGKICKVIRVSDNFVENWLCEFPRKVKTTVGFWKLTNVPDTWLRPISGIPDTKHTDEREPIKELA